MIDLQAIRSRAAARMDGAHARTPANVANRRIETPDVSHLAGLAGVAADPVVDASAPEPAAGAWTEADIARFLDRRARLLRWGWTEPDAERLAERLVKRDRERDERVSCVDCKHYRPGRCSNHRRAGLASPEVSRDIAVMPQRCPGFTPEDTR